MVSHSTAESPFVPEVFTSLAFSLVNKKRIWTKELRPWPTCCCNFDYPYSGNGLSVLFLQQARDFVNTTIGKKLINPRRVRKT